MIGEADRLCERNDVDVHFLTESEKFGLFSSESVQLLYPAKLSKREIAQFAARHELLPYKTTRYIFPVRPMGLHFPLSCPKFKRAQKEENRLQGTDR